MEIYSFAWKYESSCFVVLQSSRLHFQSIHAGQTQKKENNLASEFIFKMKTKLWPSKHKQKKIKTKLGRSCQENL